MAGRTRKVLVVDDERFFRESISETLTSAGIESVLASDGTEALASADHPAVGAVVLDVRLPGMDGLEVLRRLRERRPTLPVIMLSAHQDQTYVLEALRQGAADYLAKPLHEEELVLAVRRALESFGHASTSDRLRERLGALQEGVNRLAGLARGGASAVDALKSALPEVVAEVLAAEKTSLMLLDESGEKLIVAAAVGRSLSTDDFDPVPVGEGVAGLALARREPLLVTELANDARFAGRKSVDRYRSHSFAVAPILAGDRPLGVLCATDTREGVPLDAEDLALLRILADQAPAWLEPPAPPAPAERAIPIDVPAPSGADEAELARGVCEAVLAEVEPARVLAAALAAAGPALGAECAALFLRDQTGELVREAEWSAGGASDRERLAPGKGLTGTALETCRPIVTDEPARDPRFDAGVDTPASGAAEPFVCLPLRFRGKALGVFRAFLAEPGRATPRTGEVLGAALSSAVRAALLYRNLAASIEEVARVRREARGGA
jgi:FixJ family two-component response regulator/GAF domain-containing protein